MIYHVARNGEVLGEFSPVEFRKKVSEGEILPDDHYWRDDMADWQLVRNWRPPPIAPTVRMIPIPAASGPVASIKAAPPTLDKHTRVCLHCGYVGRSRQTTQGSSRTELILWCCLLLPGMIYSVWRLATRKQLCPRCAATQMVPVTSATAREFLTRT
jgi:hypothetical protein